MQNLLHSKIHKILGIEYFLEVEYFLSLCDRIKKSIYFIIYNYLSRFRSVASYSASSESLEHRLVEAWGKESLPSAPLMSLGSDSETKRTFSHLTQNLPNPTSSP